MRRRRPGFHGRYGGLWTDRLDAEQRLERKLAEGAIQPERAELWRAWMRDGYAILPGAVDPVLVDAINADVDAAWRDLDPRYRVETGVGGESHPLEPRLRAQGPKLLDMYVHSRAAREAAFAAPIESFLRTLFERDVLLFQGLSFELGSRQALHQDTAYVVLDSPLEFAACWIALEDVRPGSGELSYYRGSHRIEEHYFRGGYRNWSRTRDGERTHEQYLESLHTKSKARGLELERFHPRKGDALIWNADLVHGGGPITDPALTRKSFVCHYCPAGVRPFYFGHRRGRSRTREHRPGCSYASMHHALGS